MDIAKNTAYVLCGAHYDDCIFHAIFTSKAMLEEYASKYGIKLNDGYWYCVKLPVNPTDGEAL